MAIWRVGCEEDCLAGERSKPPWKRDWQTDIQLSAGARLRGWTGVSHDSRTALSGDELGSGELDSDGSGARAQ